MSRLNRTLAALLLTTMALPVAAFAQDAARGSEEVEAFVGSWRIEQTMRDRDVVSTLTISRDADGALSATWTGPQGENELSDVAFRDGKVTFERSFEGRGRRSMAMSYELTVSGGKLLGKMKTPRGDREFEGVRVDT